MDSDCTTNSTGAFVATTSTYTCLAPKSKLVRDVKRWADLQSIRGVLSGKKTSGYPALNAGSFLRAFSTSRWPSWAGELTQELGASLVTDPINGYGNCASRCRNLTTPASSSNQLCSATNICTNSAEVCAAFDPKTCWSAQANLYSCPAGSHVYTYQTSGGQTFGLATDFETLCTTYSSVQACNAQQGLCSWQNGACARGATWNGATCNELSETLCRADVKCAWADGACAYVDGPLEIGGLGQEGAMCRGELVGAGGVCGDGIVQGAEECESGLPPRVKSCRDAAGREGTTTQSCNNRCRWNEAAACQAGRCGDGVVQTPPERCDDGVLNGVMDIVMRPVE